MRIIQLPNGVKIPDEALIQIIDKTKQAPKEVREEYAQLMISNWVKMNYEDNFVSNLNEPFIISNNLNEYLEEAQ